MPHILNLFSAQIQVCVKSITKKQFSSFKSNGMTYDESCELFDDCTIVDGAEFDERVVIDLDGKGVPDSQKLLALQIKKARKNALAVQKKSRALNKTPQSKKQHYAVSIGHIKRSWSTLEIKSAFDPAKLDVLVEITEVVGMAVPVETFQVLYEKTRLKLDENDGVNDWDNYLVSDTGKIVDFKIYEEEG
jgi:hypothetical protein